MSHGFTLVREQDIPELQTHARLFRHDRTGAELLSLENDDENKVFGIAFRTPPGDSTGVAHIMEHSVLAGSRKYPLKDPFAELLKGSMKTFLNAFTYPDKTCYPVASTNLQDFYNLVDVYLDTVFYPLLRRQTFEQQGWHYELEQPGGPLIYKGVVFNEMKGVYSSPDSLLGRYTQQALFPDTTYGVDSGGDPRVMPDLTYEQFVNFHHTFYHPSNARIFFYGDDDPDERLRILDGYLREFEPIEPHSDVPLQAPFNAPREVTQFYASNDDEGEGKSMVNVAWMLGEPADEETSLALGILEYILMGTSASPLRKTLIESGLGEDVIGGLGDHLRQYAFSVGLKGVAAENTDKVEPLVLDTLGQLAHDGIDAATVEASLNTIEFALRENNTGSFPRGLALMISALNTWLYGGDPLEALAFEQPLNAIKARLAKGERLFESLIDQKLLQNQHRITLLLQPSATLAEREAEAERERLEAARATMTDADLQAIMDNTELLKRIQATPDAPEALARIPTLTLNDLDRENKTIPLDVSERDGARILFHDLFTNGIVYLDVGMNLHQLPQELLPYVSLFSRALLELGTTHEDFVQLSQRIGRTTGGIHPQVLTSVRRDSDEAAAWLFLRGKATLEHTDDLLAIMRDVLLDVQLDNRDRFRQMVLEERAGLEAGLIPGGHGVVNSRLRSRFDEADWAGEQMGGVSYLFFLRELEQKVEKDWPAVLQALQRMRQTLANRNAMICNVTADADSWQTFEPQLGAFIHALPAASSTLERWDWQAGMANEGLTIPAQVNYVGKGANLRELGYRPSGATSVITRFLGTTWLWEQVRVQGGAYGGFASFDQRSGVFTFLSYRDPNLLETLDVYDQTSTFLRAANIDETALTRSIIGTISDMDAYQLPDAKGFTSMVRYLVGDTDAIRQQLRDEVLNTTAEDFQTFADALDQLRAYGRVVVLGGPAVTAAATERPGWLEVIRVM
jgi:Zn-dependent M16 (insulinase) family peptidase